MLYIMHMTYTVSITSQGQISIPAKIRRALGLDKTSKALVSVEDKKIVIEPVKDLLELGGSLKTKRRTTPKQVRGAFEEYLAKEAVGEEK